MKTNWFLYEYKWGRNFKYYYGNHSWHWTQESSSTCLYYCHDSNVQIDWYLQCYSSCCLIQCQNHLGLHYLNKIIKRNSCYFIIIIKINIWIYLDKLNKLNRKCSFAVQCKHWHKFRWTLFIHLLISWISTASLIRDMLLLFSNNTFASFYVHVNINIQMVLGVWNVSNKTKY